MMQPVISIITICKNSANTIGATIKSILDQQIARLEYIIVDGSSTDGTFEIVKSFGTKIDICISEPDNGISDAFNKGIALASGEIIGIINSDDALLPGTLQKVIDFFSLNTNIEVMHGDVLFYDGDQFLKKIRPPARWWLPWRMGAFNIHPATFVKREVYAKHGKFDTTYRFAMDDDLFCRWLNAAVRVAYLPEPLVKVQAGGLSGRYAFSVFGEKRRALLDNGFPRILTEIQYVSRFVGQLVVILQNFFRKSFFKKNSNYNDGKHLGK
jgi:glycosyltransferase involved in cell wall biosynthesis